MTITSANIIVKTNASVTPMLRFKAPKVAMISSNTPKYLR